MCLLYQLHQRCSYTNGVSVVFKAFLGAWSSGENERGQTIGHFILTYTLANNLTSFIFSRTTPPLPHPSPTLKSSESS